MPPTSRWGLVPARSRGGGGHQPDVVPEGLGARRPGGRRRGPLPLERARDRGRPALLRGGGRGPAHGVRQPDGRDRRVWAGAHRQPRVPRPRSHQHADAAAAHDAVVGPVRALAHPPGHLDLVAERRRGRRILVLARRAGGAPAAARGRDGEHGAGRRQPRHVPPGGAGGPLRSGPPGWCSPRRSSGRRTTTAATGW